MGIDNLTLPLIPRLYHYGGYGVIFLESVSQLLPICRQKQEPCFDNAANISNSLKPILNSLRRLLLIRSFEPKINKTFVMDYKAELTSTGGYISIGYAENVENTAEVRSAVLDGRLNSTVLRGCLIPDPLLITVAGNKVALADQRNNLRLISPFKSIFHTFLKLFGAVLEFDFWPPPPSW